MGTKQEYKLENKSTTGKNLELDKGGDLNSLSLLIGISHEIRTYVNAIVGFTSLLELKSYEEEANEFRDQIFKSCEQVVELYTGFLDSVLIDSGEINTDTKICDLDNLLFNLISEFKEIFKKEGNPDVVFETEFNYSGLSEVMIDSGKVLKIIRCLFQNAIKNTKSGFIKIGFDYNNNIITAYILDSSTDYYKYKEFLNTNNLDKSLKIFFDTSSAINILLAKKLIQFLGGTIWTNWSGHNGTSIYFTIPLKTNEISAVQRKEYANSLNIN